MRQTALRQPCRLAHLLQQHLLMLKVVKLQEHPLMRAQIRIRFHLWAHLHLLQCTAAVGAEAVVVNCLAAVLEVILGTPKRVAVLWGRQACCLEGEADFM